MTFRKILTNSAIASLFPSLAPAAIFFLTVPPLGIIVAATLFVCFCAFFACISYLLQWLGLERSILITLVSSLLLPAAVLLYAVNSPINGQEDFVYIMAFLSLIGGFYVGWLNKTS